MVVKSSMGSFSPSTKPCPSSSTMSFLGVVSTLSTLASSATEAFSVGLSGPSGRARAQQVIKRRARNMRYLSMVRFCPRRDWVPEQTKESKWWALFYCSTSRLSLAKPDHDHSLTTQWKWLGMGSPLSPDKPERRAGHTRRQTDKPCQPTATAECASVCVCVGVSTFVCSLHSDSAVESQK